MADEKQSREAFRKAAGQAGAHRKHFKAGQGRHGHPRGVAKPPHPNHVRHRQR